MQPKTLRPQDKCDCGSGLSFRKCHMEKTQPFVKEFNLGRNDPCHCGAKKTINGKDVPVKYKKCCLDKDDIVERLLRGRQVVNPVQYTKVEPPLGMMEEKDLEDIRLDNKDGTTVIIPGSVVA